MLNEDRIWLLKTRYYDPITCQFINQDNLLGANKGVYCYNLFAYCSNNPTNLTDSNGTFAWAIFGLIYAAAIVVTAAVTSYAFGQSKPNTGITWEDVGNTIWNTIVFIVDLVGSTVRALNPPAVQSTQKNRWQIERTLRRLFILFLFEQAGRNLISQDFL